MNLDGTNLNSEHEELQNVQIPDEVLRMYTTTPDEADIPVAVVRIMAAELMRWRKKDADYRQSWWPRANPPSLGDK